MKKMLVVNALLFVLLSVCIMSCDLFKSTVYVKFDQKTFNEQKKLWQTSNVKNYQYEFLASGFIGYHGTVVVENGNFKNDLPLYEYSDFKGFMDYSTIDKIYKTIEESFYEYNNTKQSIINDFYYTEILVEYDRINHIPVNITYDYNTPQMTAIDGTFDYEINNFSRW